MEQFPIEFWYWMAGGFAALFAVAMFLYSEECKKFEALEQGALIIDRKCLALERRVVALTETREILVNEVTAKDRELKALRIAYNTNAFLARRTNPEAQDPDESLLRDIEDRMGG